MNQKTWELLPFWFPQSRNNIIWALIFFVLFTLSIDFWNWDSNSRISEWLPFWVLYLVVVQFALAFSIWKFSKLFDPVIIEREVKVTEEEAKEEPIIDEKTEKEPKEELISDDSNNNNNNNNRITNIYISDSIINRSIIGDKDDKDE